MRDIIIRKTLILLAVGLICLTVGLTYGIITKDKLLILMSLIICFVNVYKVYELQRIRKQKKYTVISGRCLESVYKIMGKYRIFRIQEGDDIIEISVPKNVKLKVNEVYNLYFEKSNLDTESYNGWLKNKILSENFLGYEVINVE